MDDDHNDRALLGMAVDRTDLNIWLQSVTDGQEAIDYLEGRDGYADRSMHPLPDLVLSDLNMRMTGGLEFLVWRRSSRLFSSLPVVILSGSVHERAIDEAMRMGASRFIAKPFAFEDWKAVARQIWEFGVECREAAR
jgi:CheY-like chemotaxis protein